jgi:hypothetical protein
VEFAGGFPKPGAVTAVCPDEGFLLLAKATIATTTTIMATSTATSDNVDDEELEAVDELWLVICTAAEDVVDGDEELTDKFEEED